MRRFKKHFATLLVLGVFALFILPASPEAQEAGLSSDKANSISLKMLSYSDPGSGSRGVRALQDWEERTITGNVKLDIAVDGFRARSGNLMQRGPVDGKNPEDGMSINPSTSYPVKCQFLVVADVPAGVKQVSWNICSGSTCGSSIIGTPAGSQFIDSKHVVTPIGPTTVQIENTHYAIITRREGTISLPGNWEAKLGNYSEANFYNRSGDSETWRVEYKRGFTIGANQTYIILTATRLGQTDIIASCEGIHPAESLVFAAVDWVKQPKPLEEDIGEKEEHYNFAANIVDTDESDPIDLEDPEGPKEVEFEIQIENKGTTDIPKDLLVFRIYPDRKENWWSNSPIDGRASRTDSYCFKWTALDKSASKTIPRKGQPGSIATVTISPRQVDPNVIIPGIQIENTELYFVGPLSSGDVNAHGIRTNESTTVVAGEMPIQVSGLASMYSRGVIALRNQDVGPVYLDTLNDGPISEPTVLPGIKGPGSRKRISFDEETATVKFHVKSKRNGEEQIAKGSVTLRY